LVKYLSKVKQAPPAKPLLVNRPLTRFQIFLVSKVKQELGRP
jgi:hypothetical protein